MYRVIIADDEKIILNGLKKLIDWEKLGIEIVGEATNGKTQLQLIEERKPDLVISDIMMPGMTGLEVIAALEEINVKPKFIFISGYQEFAYAKEALSRGAVDYLLKPVSRKALEQSVKKAIGQIQNESTVGIFREEKTEIQKLFEQINDGQEYASSDMYAMFSRMNIDCEGKEFQGLTFGLMEKQEEEFRDFSVEKQNLIRFSTYNHICDWFRNEKQGFCIRKEEDRVHIMGLYPKGERDIYLESVVIPLKALIEQEHGVRLCVGIGMPGSDAALLKNTYKTADLAYNLYFFEKRPIIDFMDIHKDYTISFDDYTEGCEAVFKSIVAKDGQVMKCIDRVMDMIAGIHYGNKYAARARTMHFTGDLGMKLYRYHMLDGDFYVMQDALQKKVESLCTFEELKDCIMQHYEQLLQEIYRTVKSKDTMLIEDVKNYIQENYNKDLSIRELAEVACVSPNYFSALFKKETGENYKAYLTSIRMAEAMRLVMETDMRSYEIGEHVGYNNVRRFVDAFRAAYGVSPSEYRKNMRGEA